MTMSAVPELRGPEPVAGTVVRRPAVSGVREVARWAFSRRNLLRTGTALGMAALSVFPAARRAYADGYDIYGACPSYASDHDCSPGCGPSTIFADSCAVSGTQTGFHKNDGSTWLLRPNQCYSGTYDGWLWRHQGACGACACSIERRCHDGYRRTSSGWVKSICRWTTECGCLSTVSWRTARRGDTGPNVRTVQHLLTYRGYPTTVDGIFGSATEARVKEFEAANGLNPDGVVDAATWRALVVTVRRGNSGHAVRGAQRQLNKHAYGLAVDGAFGTATEAAALDFQRHNGLTADGVVGENTWRTLVGSGGV